MSGFEPAATANPREIVHGSAATNVKTHDPAGHSGCRNHRSQQIADLYLLSRAIVRGWHRPKDSWHSQAGGTSRRLCGSARAAERKRAPSSRQVLPRSGFQDDRSSSRTTSRAAEPTPLPRRSTEAEAERSGLVLQRPQQPGRSTRRRVFLLLSSPQRPRIGLPLSVGAQAAR